MDKKQIKTLKTSLPETYHICERCMEWGFCLDRPSNNVYRKQGFAFAQNDFQPFLRECKKKPR